MEGSPDSPFLCSRRGHFRGGAAIDSRPRNESIDSQCMSLFCSPFRGSPIQKNMVGHHSSFPTLPGISASTAAKPYKMAHVNQQKNDGPMNE